MNKSQPKARAALRKAFSSAKVASGPYKVTTGDRNDDMSYYVYRQNTDHFSRMTVAEGLYREDAQFIAACYNHVGTLLEEED